MDIGKILAPKKEPPRKTFSYDNPRENIDPHVKTKVLDANEIVLGGVRRTIWPTGGSAHASLTQLDYASAAHTGFAPALGADDNFVTDTEKTNIGTLTNDSMADALHRHSELSASDGTPNPALSVDTAGNVGIGTTSPSLALDVVGNIKSSGTYPYLQLAPTGWSSYIQSGVDTVGSTSNANFTTFLNPTGKGFSFSINNSAKLIVNTDGNVGIGTTGPLEKLQIAGNVLVSHKSSFSSLNSVGTITPLLTLTDGAVLAGNNVVVLGNVGNGYEIGAPGGAAMIMEFGGVNTIRFYAGGSERISLLANGNVGIGTTSPSLALDVVGNIKSSGTYPYLQLAPTGWSSYIQSGVDTVGSISNANFTTFLNPTGKGFSFSINSSAKLVVNTDGNVGIGTTAPGTKLQVVGMVSGSSLYAGNGATGTFTTVDLKTVTVSGGIIITIV